MSDTYARADIDWEHRKRVIIEVQAAGGTSADAAERLGMKANTLARTALKMGVPFTDRKGTPIDWGKRRDVIMEVQKAGGTSAGAAEILGINVDTVLKTARKLGIRFPSNNGYHGQVQRAKPVKPCPGQKQPRERMKAAGVDRFRAIRFARALDEAPEQPMSDAELIAQAIAAGRVTRFPSGSGLSPGWLAGIHDQCVKPRPGASKGGRAAP